MEITCPHCQAQHACEATVCPVCGTPVAGSPAPAPQRAVSTEPAERAGAALPLAPVALARRHAPALIAPWRLVLLGVTGTLVVVALLVITITRLFAHPLAGNPPIFPTATGAPAVWSPSAVTPSALPVASPAPTATGTPHPATATPGGAPGGASPTATAPPATATATSVPPTATATMILPTETSTALGGG